MKRADDIEVEDFIAARLSGLEKRALALKMNGATNKGAAAMLGVHEDTVARALRKIAEKWAEEGAARAPEKMKGGG